MRCGNCNNKIFNDILYKYTGYKKRDLKLCSDCFERDRDVTNYTVENFIQRMDEWDFIWVGDPVGYDYYLYIDYRDWLLETYEKLLRKRDDQQQQKMDDFLNG